MFVELLYSNDLDDEEINKIRDRFGLKPDGPDEEDNAADNVQVKQEIQELDDDDDDVKFKSKNPKISFKNPINFLIFSDEESFIDENQETDDEKLEESLSESKRQRKVLEDSDFLPDDDFVDAATSEPRKKEKKKHKKHKKADKREDMVKDENFE